MPLTIDEFKAAHARIEAGLKAAEAVEGDLAQLTLQLKAMREDVLAHFKAKDAFYPDLAAQCTKAGDTAGAHLANIFESNMRVQSAAVQRFFESLETAPQANLVGTFRTVTTVIRQRFGTEERAVFPLFVRSAKTLGAP